MYFWSLVQAVAVYGRVHRIEKPVWNLNIEQNLQNKYEIYMIGFKIKYIDEKFNVKQLCTLEWAIK